ncbi:FIG00529998: hypothetical protein [Clostridium tyrobutyricum DIVETGP]|uniref:Uncharacterized protein n=2 Tax=Clostridium tyrobutyricum TaxID=1519 RepID=W6N9G0_CLOTY|nr:hypothetical protein CTK_C04490 [Clostridium tyrobutyricum]CDL92154.1 FIG00529998: hypothetical protein [Clostridium tyrobutyricum DIVETGP]
MKPRLDTESKIKVEEILEKSSQGEVDIMVSNLSKSIDNIFDLKSLDEVNEYLK